MLYIVGWHPQDPHKIEHGAPAQVGQAH